MEPSLLGCTALYNQVLPKHVFVRLTVYRQVAVQSLSPYKRHKCPRPLKRDGADFHLRCWFIDHCDCDRDVINAASSAAFRQSNRLLGLRLHRLAGL